MRIHHMDNLRTAMVACVVLLHAVMAYNPFADWWYAPDTTKLPGTEVLCFLFDSFPLPILFFLAGFFGAASLRARPPLVFLRAKLLRMGAPLLLVSATLLPIIPWVTYTSRNLYPHGALNLWFTFLDDALVPKWIMVQDMPDYATMGVHFTQYHLWFISLLLVFYLFHAGLKATGRQQMLPHLKAGPGMLLGAVSIILCMTVVNLTVHEWSWLNLGWLLFQPVRLPLYLGCYLLGAAAHDRNWLQGGTPAGAWWTWLLGAMFFTGCYITVSSHLMMKMGPHNIVSGLVQSTIRTGMSLTLLGCLLKGFASLGHGHNAFTAMLARHSYAIYLLHMFPCVLIQAWLSRVNIHAWTKLTLVVAGSLLVPVIGGMIVRKIMAHGPAHTKTDYST